MSDETPRKPAAKTPIGERPAKQPAELGRSSARSGGSRAGGGRSGSVRPGSARVPAQGSRPQGPRPEHPTRAATLLIIGVTLLIFAISAVSTFSGR